jgi:hypothetical protein
MKDERVKLNLFTGSSMAITRETQANHHLQLKPHYSFFIWYEKKKFTVGRLYRLQKAVYPKMDFFLLYSLVDMTEARIRSIIGQNKKKN